MREIFTLLLFFTIFTANATDFYVSNTGNDQNDGLSENSPWKSIDKVNQEMNNFSSGDNIFFKKGDEFFGTLIISNKNNLEFGSYGAGNAPIITGGRIINNWVNLEGNMYESNVKEPVYQLIYNNKLLSNARTPDQDYYKISTVISDKTSFTSKSLIGSKSLVGAMAHIRSAPWRLSARKIVEFNSSTGKVVLESGTVYSMQKGEEFFINNNRNLIKKNGDWSYDTNLNKLFFYSSSTPKDIYASVLNNLIEINNSTNVNVKNLNLRYSNKTGIYLNNSNNIVIDNNSIEFSYEYGVRIEGGRLIDITNSSVSYALFAGISCLADNTNIVGNVIENTGLLQNISYKWIEDITGVQGGIGIHTSNSESKIENNQVLSSGYNGIDYRGKNAIIRHNFVENFCLTTHDGGGIYTYNPYSSSVGAAGSLVSENIVVSNKEFDAKWAGFGIYLDDNTHHIEVVGNGIAGCSLGIFFHNTNNHIARNNNIFNITKSGVEFGEDELVGDGNLINNTFENNYIFSENESFAPIKIRSAYDNYKFGVFDNNKYFNPVSKRNIKIENSKSNKYLSLKEWQTLSNQDLNSKVNDFIWDDFVVDEVIGENLIINSDFEESIDNWGGYNSDLFLESENGNNFLRANSSYNSATVTSNPFSIAKNKTYLLEFDIKSDSPKQYWLNLRMEKSPYTPFLKKNIDSYKEWTHYAVQFNSNIDEAEALVGFTINSDYPDLDLDNVRFTEVKFGKTPTRSQMVYNTETKNKTISLYGPWEDLDGNSYKASIMLKPFESKILLLSDYSNGVILADAGQDVEICKGEKTVLEATGGSSYIWNTGETTARITVTPSETTTYSVTVSDGANSDIDYVVVTVNEPPTVNAGSDVTLCAGESTVLTATGEGNFLWSTGETTESIFVNPSQTMTYSVTASNACGSGAKDDMTVTVIEKPILELSNDITLEKGSSIELIASGTGSFLWSTGETTSNIVVSPNSTTRYTVTLTSDNGCSTVESVLVTVDDLEISVVPDARPSINVDICKGESVTLTASRSDSYLWSTGEITASITVNPTETTTYSVLLNDNSLDSYNVSVFVDETCSVINNRSISNEIKVFPNPTDGLINIELTGYTGEINIDLYTMGGKTVYSESLNGISTDKVLKCQIDLSRFAKGVYFVRIKNKIKSSTKKILVL